MNGKILKCASCGAVAEELVSCECPCSLECCGEKMAELKPNSIDASKEKHVPVATAIPGGGTKVSVGSAPHPMTPEHYIVWIEIVNGPYVNRRMLKPGEAPEAVFYVDMKPGMIVRAYCNLHNLWESRIG